MQEDNGAPPNDELEGRLLAHRRVLQWILAHLMSEEARQELIDELGENYPPLDHQEDPGAVPDVHFPELAAQAREMKLLLDAVRDRTP